MRRPAVVPPLAATRPTIFIVGDHTIVVTNVREQRWSVSVDNRDLDASFATQADAWEAGVRDAARLDALRGS